MLAVLTVYTPSDTLTLSSFFCVRCSQMIDNGFEDYQSVFFLLRRLHDRRDKSIVSSHSLYKQQLQVRKMISDLFLSLFHLAFLLPCQTRQLHNPHYYLLNKAKESQMIVIATIIMIIATNHPVDETCLRQER